MVVRKTRQRHAIEQLLRSSDHFRSAQQIHLTLHEEGEKIGLATVYRNLQQMAEDGEIDALHNEYGETLYRRCAKASHHHHLVCRRCGTTCDISGEAVEKWVAQVSRDHGFTHVEHTADLFGLCAACSRQVHDSAR